MKKMFFGIAMLMVMVASVSMFASTQTRMTRYNYISINTHVSSQGTYCNGTVGCGCSGFSPITNGDVWQQAYCKHCGHKRSVHK